MHAEHCDCRVKLAERLAKNLDSDWPVSSVMDVHHVSVWLDISPEDTRTLILAGLLVSDDGENVRIGELVKFLEETDWLALRAQRNLETLRAYAYDVYEGPETPTASHS